MGTKKEEEAFEQDIQQIAEVVEELATRKRPPGVAAVTDDERLHFAPPRDDFESLVAKLRAMAARAGVNLAKHNLDDMEAAIARAAKLQPLLSRMEQVFSSWHASVEHTVLKNRSDAWRIFTAYYSALASFAAADGELQQEYKELEAFFAHPPRARVKKAEANEDSEVPVAKPKVVNG